MNWFRPLSLCAVVAAALAAAAAAPVGSAALTCPGQTYVQPFKPWGDLASYVAVPNGSLESTSGWKLSGGASLVTGNEPYHVNKASDTHSLSLPPGATAVSPPMCTTLFHPDLRFFAENTGSTSSTLGVDVISTVAGLLPVTTPVASLVAGPAWQPTAPLPYLTNLLAPLTSSTQFRFTAIGRGGSWRIDDVYVDPLKSH